MPQQSLSEGCQVFISQPVGFVGGEVTVPGDKSISHRALLLSSIADGTSIIRGFLHSEDCLATLAALRAMAVDVAAEGSDLKILGVGIEGLQSPPGPLDLGNSGTATGFLLVY